MFKNYLKIALRNIKRHKGYAFINIAGLAVGISSFILILLYTNYEFSYESHNPNASRVYRIYVEHQESDEVYRVSSTPVPLVKALHEEISDIQDFTRYDGLPNLVVNHQEKRFVENNMIAADPGIFDILGFHLLSGDRKTALKDAYSVVVTEDVAEKYFGNEDPIGKTLIVDNSINLMVQGVIRNHPPNTDFDPDILTSFSTIKELFGSDYMSNWLSQVLDSYILVPEHHSVDVLEGKIENCFSKFRSKENDMRILKLELLSRMHLYSIFGNNNSRNISIFLGVGILIIIIACINYMNLATARSARRAREVGMRKVVGAQKKQIIIQFLGESFVYVFLAICVALLLSAGLIPLLRNITGQALRFKQIFQIPILISLFSALVIIGFLSGSYPALFLSSLGPASILKDTIHTGKRSALFRKILVVGQFSISIILIICTLIFIHQINYMTNKSLGFQKNQIVVIRNPARRSPEPFKQMLKDNPSIVNVCGSLRLPHSIGMYNEVTWEGAISDDEIISIKHNTVDYDFLKTYEILLLAGRNFSRDFPSDIRGGSGDPENAGAVILNETAVERFGWDDPIGKKVIQTFGQQRIVYTVIGVVRDFHFSSLRNPIVPLKIFLGSRPSYVSIKIRPEGIHETLKKIESAWKQFNPNYPFEYFFYDSVFKQRYQQEQNLRVLFQYFSSLAVFIGCLGLFGLASFAVEQRTKEIGIRKILGATSQGLVLLLNQEFAKWVLIANLVAWPLAYFAMNQWLKGYAYHTSIDLWIFIFSGVLTLAIALLTVSIQSVKAAVANPAKSLRYE